MFKIKRSYSTFLLVFLVLAVFFTRFWNLSWGLPYPFHPDERNMAIAIEQLQCPNIFDIHTCFNPNFFAYGQFPLYLGYLGGTLMRLFDGDFYTSASLPEAILALRIISAFFSLATMWVVWKTVDLLYKTSGFAHRLVVSLLFIFSPALIQFAHFGTTESMLMFFYAMITYVSLLLIQSKISERKFILITSLVVGLSIATKISSAIFIFIPLMSYFYQSKDKQRLPKTLFRILLLGICSIFFAIIFSPHNLISWSDFTSSIRYETSVAQGVPVFYTRPFMDTIPVLYQITHIFPYALGLPVFILFLFGFILLPWRKEINILRLGFLVYFLPTAFLYAKWSRFMAPVFPIMLLIAALYILHFGKNTRAINSLTYFLIFIAIVPGITFMSIYLKPDVRIEASEWIAKNIPQDSYLLSETANVVDIPISLESEEKTYILNSFDFYHTDENTSLQQDLKRAVERADYILIPSRRVFKNHTCQTEDQESTMENKKCEDLNKRYPLVNKYYKKLFNGELGFKKVAEFSSYPQINIAGKSAIFPDEDAEETWTVFDHPVIRIYKKI